MSIFMITREHEYETGNGSVYDDYVDEHLGYFTTREDAEKKLEELRAAEQAAHIRKFIRGEYGAWARRVEENQQIQAQNEVLEAAGLPLVHERWVGEEPKMVEWTDAMSDYKVIEIQRGGES